MVAKFVAKYMTRGATEAGRKINGRYDDSQFVLTMTKQLTEVQRRFGSRKIYVLRVSVANLNRLASLTQPNHLPTLSHRVLMVLDCATNKLTYINLSICREPIKLFLFYRRYFQVKTYQNRIIPKHLQIRFHSYF